MATPGGKAGSDHATGRTTAARGRRTWISRRKKERSRPLRTNESAWRCLPPGSLHVRQQVPMPSDRPESEHRRSVARTCLVPSHTMEKLKDLWRRAVRARAVPGTLAGAGEFCSTGTLAGCGPAAWRDLLPCRINMQTRSDLFDRLGRYLGRDRSQVVSKSAD
jgi:hypothetical protein